MNNRYTFIDATKSFAIFTVVLGHVVMNYASPINDIVHNYCILPYHMPLFMIISGIFYKPQLGWASIKTKLCRLLIPFLFFCFFDAFFIGLVRLFINRLLYDTPIHYMGLFFNFIEEIINWGWWYIRALIVCYVYSYIFVRICKNRNTVACLFSIIFLYSLSFGGIIPNKMELFKGAIFLYPFLWIGFYIRKFILQDISSGHKQKTFFVFAVNLFIFLLLLSYWGGYPDTFYEMNTSVFVTEGYKGIYGSIIIWKTVYRILIGTSASIAILLFFKFLFELFLGNNLLISNLVQYVGNRTLPIYMLHAYFFYIYSDKNLFGEGLFAFIASVSLSILFICLILWVVKFVSQNRLLSLLLLGKKY